MADQKLTALSSITAPDLADLVYMVDDPSGSPASYKSTLAILLGQGLPHVAQGRLTLVTGQPVYAPLVSLTPSATDTGAETVDFAADHGWVTGTRVIPQATVGGLTIGVQYFIRATDSNTIAFYTTLANALADSSRVNLTANITQAISPVGVAGTTLYYTPFHGNRISLFDGSKWNLYTFTEISIALSALTSGRPYDVFAYDSGGSVALELLSWTSDTVRATALTTQDGIYVKAGATTRRYIGSIYTTGTDSTEDSAWRRYVFNASPDVRVRQRLRRYDITASTWTLTAGASPRQGNANADNQVSVMQGLADAFTEVNLTVAGRHTNTSSYNQIWISLDTITAGDTNYQMSAYESITVAGDDQQYDADFYGILPVGQHDLMWAEYTANDTATWLGSSHRAHMNGWFEC